MPRRAPPSTDPADPPPHRVRRPALLGRHALLARAREALDAAPLVTLRGPPGVGKSSLARALADSDPARPWLIVDAAHAPDADALLAAIAAALALELRLATPRVALERIARALDETRSVLVIDHADRAPVAMHALVADLAAGLEQGAVLRCAWRALGAPDERVLDVPPLATDDAVALLRGRLAASPDGPALDDATARALVERASALPLALELLAARIGTLGLRVVTSSLAEPLGLDALDDALARAVASLRGEDLAVLVALCALRAPFDARTASDLAGGSHALASIERLVGSSLVRPLPADPADEDAPRFSVLDVVRDHVSRRHPSDEARARHARYFAGLPRTGADDRAGWARLVASRADLLCAWEHALEHDALCAARLALRVEPLLLTRGPTELHRALGVRTLAALDAHPEASAERAAHAADLRLSLGRVEAIRGHFRQAIGFLRAALADAERADDGARVGWCAAGLCFALRPLGAFDEARAHGERALACALGLRSHAMTAQAEQVLATVSLAQGRTDEALAGYRRALASARLAAAPRLEGIALANSAYAHQRAGRHDEALGVLEQSRRCFLRSDDRVHLVRLAVLEQALRVDTAREPDDRALLAALDEALALDDLTSELEARETLARAAHAQGDGPLFDERRGALEACARFTDDVSWGPRVEALCALGAPAPRALGAPCVALSRSGDRVALGPRELDFSRRGPLKRVLLALVAAHQRAPGASLRLHDVQAAGWPGERMLPESAAARVYMAVRRLRALGFERLLRTSDEGYALDPRVEVRWLDGPG